MQIITSLTLLPHPEYSSPRLSSPQTFASIPEIACRTCCCCRHGSLQIITSLTLLPHPEYSSPRLSEDGSEQPSTAEVDSSAQQQQQQHAEAKQQRAEAEGLQQQQRSERYITLIASTRVPQAAGCPSTFRMRIPKLQGYFTGTGVLQKKNCVTMHVTL
jgi:hypothetical protein